MKWKIPVTRVALVFCLSYIGYVFICVLLNDAFGGLDYMLKNWRLFNVLLI